MNKKEDRPPHPLLFRKMRIRLTLLCLAVTGVILAAGRGFGEAAVLLYTTGSGSDLRWGNWNLASPTCPLNPLRPAETLAIQIWNLQTNGQDRALANLSSTVLLLLVLAFSIGANMWSRRLSKKNSGEKS